MLCDEDEGTRAEKVIKGPTPRVDGCRRRGDVRELGLAEIEVVLVCLCCCGDRGFGRSFLDFLDGVLGLRGGGRGGGCSSGELLLVLFVGEGFFLLQGFDDFFFEALDESPATPGFDADLENEEEEDVDTH